MARIRTIKQDLYLDEELAGSSIAARYLFPGLWTLADREGRLEDRPLRIKAQLYPYDDVDVSALLDELELCKAILRYKINSRKYIQIRTFSKHQRVNCKEQPSTIPPCPIDAGMETHINSRASTEKHGQARKFPSGMENGEWRMGNGKGNTVEDSTGATEKDSGAPVFDGDEFPDLDLSDDPDEIPIAIQQAAGKYLPDPAGMNRQKARKWARMLISQVEPRALLTTIDAFFRRLASADNPYAYGYAVLSNGSVLDVVTGRTGPERIRGQPRSDGDVDLKIVMADYYKKTET